jgi:DNA repair exonuclease SbcCD nuclease subunit
MKILHTADWHVRDRDIEEIEKCLGCVVETAKKEKVDLFVIAGDCFDSRDIKLDSLSAKLVVKTMSELADICPVVIIIGTPSHDGTAAEVLNYAKGKYPVHVATKPEQFILDNIVLSLVPQPTKQFFNQGDIQASNDGISQGMNGLFAGFGAKAAEYKSPHVLVYHGSISGAKLSTGQTLTGMDIEVSTDQLKLSGAQLILCGHIHLPQELPGNVFYSGSVYANNYGEMHKHGFYIHEFNNSTILKSEFIETPCKKLEKFETNYTDGLNNIDDVAFIKWLKPSEGAHVRHDITVWQDQAGKVDKETIRQNYIERGAIDADIRIIRVPRQTVRSESVLKVESLRDKLVAMAAIKEETVPESILIKAGALEVGPAEEVIKRAT